MSSLVKDNIVGVGENRFGDNRRVDNRHFFKNIENHSSNFFGKKYCQNID